jgi:hypothetical protein
VKNKNTPATIDYEERVQTALRGVVADALRDVAKSGLPGRHHFFIAFATDHPGVQISDYLFEQYPEEMTIVLQHEYWDLAVEDTSFSVTLCFNDVNERLVIPFDSIISFVDPSVKFGLQFTPDYDAFDHEDFIADAKKELSKKSSKDEEPKVAGDGESNVVTLDAFRKKP